jgi:glutamyl-tRNA synthetase
VESWLNDSQQQLDLSEQKQMMAVIGLKESDLPEILVHDFRKNGYLPEALLNFLALLGWNPGGDREKMSIAELTQLFSLEGVNKSGAKFDREKLLAFNTDACANSSQERLIAAFRDYLKVNPDSPLNRATDDQLAALLKMKSGFRVLRDVDESSRFLFMADEQIQYDPQAVEKVLRKQNGIVVLRDIRPLLTNLADWTHGPIEKLIEGYCQEKQLGLGKVAQPIRVAVSGGTISPPIFQSLEFLGKDRTLARIAKCLAATG